MFENQLFCTVAVKQTEKVVPKDIIPGIANGGDKETCREPVFFEQWQDAFELVGIAIVEMDTDIEPLVVETLPEVIVQRDDVEIFFKDAEMSFECFSEQEDVVETQVVMFADAVIDDDPCAPGGLERIGCQSEQGTGILPGVAGFTAPDREAA